MSRSQLMAQLAMMLGSRAAERVVFDEITTGASNDLEGDGDGQADGHPLRDEREKLGPMAIGPPSGDRCSGARLQQPAGLLRTRLAFQIDRRFRSSTSPTTAEDRLVQTGSLISASQPS